MLFDRAGRWLTSIGFGWFIALCIGAAILRNGLWVIPNFSLQRLVASNPFVNPVPHEPFAHYLLYSPFAYLVAHAAGAYKTRLSFLLFHLALTLLTVAAMLLIVRSRRGDIAARWLGLAFVALPISANLLMWLGNLDIFTFIISTALAIFAHPIVVTVLGVGLGFNHFEQGFFALGALSVFQWISRQRSRVAIVLQLAGLATGRVLVSVWFAANDIEVNEGRWLYVREMWLNLMTHGLLKLPVLVFSTFGAFWLVVVVFVLAIWGENRRAVWATVSIFFGLLAPAILGADHTRIFAMISWPIVTALILWVHEDANTDWMILTDRLAGILVAACIVIPPFVVWGQTYSSMLPYDIAAGIDVVAGTRFVFNGPEWFMAPFR